MAGWSTVQRSARSSHQQASSDEMAETLRAWDDEVDEMVEYLQKSKANGANLSRNVNGEATASDVSASKAVPRYSSSSVRAAKTVCLYVCFFGLGSCVAILGPTLLELMCHTSTKLERMSYVFTSRAFGYLTGSIIGGWFYDKYNGYVVLALSCVWGTLMMMVLPYVTSLLGLVIVTVLLGVGLGSLNTGGNVLLLSTWGKKSRPYVQILHFVFALGAFFAPLIVQPFLQESTNPEKNDTDSSGNDSISVTWAYFSNSSQCLSNETLNTRCYCFSTTFNETDGSTFPVIWAYWISSIPLAIAGVGFLVFVFIKSCSLQDKDTKDEDAPKTKEGSLMYRVTILSLFSVFLLLYVGLEVAYAGYIFTYGYTSNVTMSKDSSAFLTSGFWGSFALARLAAVPISRYLRPSKILFLDLMGCVLGSLVLISQIKDGDCCAADSTKLWVGTVILGVSMASVFPTALSWAEYFLTVSGGTASVLVVASSCGEMLIPLAVGSTIGNKVGPCSLMACAFVIGILTVVTFLLIWATGRYFKRNSAFAGMLYQRNQKQEEGRKGRQPDEVLELLEQNNEEFFNNGDKNVTI